MKALIVIDYTNDFVHEEGALTCGKPGQAIEKRIIQLTRLFADQGDAVVMAVDLHRKEDPYHPENKYLEYKKMVDYHYEKCGYYKSRSKTKYMKHYRYYKYYYVKMTYYAKKCGYTKESYEHDQACETHTHYKHYYHHHHIEKHHHHCEDSSH